ncbi:MAG: GNAT family N-acetyltransferase, partial [Gammaproteobacteria bacterium]|nr:GNAT family N-acetyltransferase [Gammaproteobacteria bacterium]
LVRPAKRHAAAFIEATARSRRLYRNLMTPMKTEAEFVAFVKRCRNNPRSCNFLVMLEKSNELAGAINIENISRGFFQSAALGYFAFLPHAGKGHMREGLILTIDHAFRKLKLHRLEANIQPTNRRSIALVESLGFELEGYSPRFLKICGRWRDHERWAIRVENWKPSRLS